MIKDKRMRRMVRNIPNKMNRRTIDYSFAKFAVIRKFAIE